MFKFRLITHEDYPLMLAWLAKSHVREWWDDSDDTLEKVRLHYGEKLADVKKFILVETKNDVEKPIGFFQYYIVSDDTIGIDQFVGEADYLNRGVGAETIKIFIELIKRRHSPKTIILDPSPDNKRAIRCYEKVGFKYYETKLVEDGKTAYMMRYEFRDE